MKRAGRIIFNAIIVLAMGLFVITLGLWIRSYQIDDVITVETMSFAPVGRFPLSEFKQTNMFFVGNLYGKVFYNHIIANWWHEKRPTVWQFNSQAAVQSYKARQFTDGGNRYGIYWRWQPFDKIGPPNDSSTGNSVTHRIAIPHAYLLVLFSTLPSICFYRRLRRRYRYLPGQCVSCGYDLRATPHRCPECGTVSTRE